MRGTKRGLCMRGVPYDNRLLGAKGGCAWC